MTYFAVCFVCLQPCHHCSSHLWKWCYSGCQPWILCPLASPTSQHDCGDDKIEALKCHGKYQNLPSLIDSLKWAQWDDYHSGTVPATHSLESLLKIGDQAVFKVNFITDPMSSLLWHDRKIWLCASEIISMRHNGKLTNILDLNLTESTISFIYQSQQVHIFQILLL